MKEFTVTKKQKSNKKNEIPFSAEIEQAVLGAMMIDTIALTEALEIITKDSFYEDRNKIIFSAIHNLFTNENEVDFVSISEELKKIDKNSIVDSKYLSSVSIATPTSAYILQHCQILHELFLKRQLIDNNKTIIEEALDRRTDAFELIDNQQNQMDNLLERTVNTIISPDKQANVFLTSYKNSLENKDKYPKTGIKKFDDTFGPFLPGQMVVIAARPSIGKTSLALSITKNMSQAKVNVAFLSLEMTAFELLTKLFAMDSNISSEYITKGVSNRELEIHIEQFTSKLPNTNIYIDDSSNLNEVNLYAKLKRMVKLYNIKVAFVDYLGLMDCSQKKSNRESEISHISRKIKAIAKKLQITIFALVQINRQAEMGKYPTPAMHNLRDSGSIEQDADIVILIDRPEFYGLDNFEDKEPCYNKARLIVAKKRGGRTGTVTVDFKRDTTEFYDMDIGGVDSITDDDYLPMSADEEEYPF